MYYVTFRVNQRIVAAPFRNRDLANELYRSVQSDPSMQPSAISDRLPPQAIEMTADQARALLNAGRTTGPAFGVAGLGKAACSVMCPEGGASGGSAASFCSVACPERAAAAESQQSSQKVVEATQQLIEMQKAQMQQQQAAQAQPASSGRASAMRRAPGITQRVRSLPRGAAVGGGALVLLLAVIGGVVYLAKKGKK